MTANLFFEGQITRFTQHLCEREVGIEVVWNVEAQSAVDGSIARCEFDVELAGVVPKLSPGMRFTLRESTGGVPYAVEPLFDGVMYQDIHIGAVDIEASLPNSGGRAGFGANVQHSWECPQSLQDEAQRRARESDMTVVFDVNTVKVTTQRGTLIVTVNPPPAMAGFTLDICMLTWQVELRELGLAE